MLEIEGSRCDSGDDVSPSAGRRADMPAKGRNMDTSDSNSSAHGADQRLAPVYEGTQGSGVQASAPENRNERGCWFGCIAPSPTPPCVLLCTSELRRQPGAGVRR